MGVKLVSSSGGSVELVAPTTASNYSLTVPANNGTVLTNQTAGTVLQVVSTTKTSVFTTSSTTFVAVTGFSVTITPTNASNKIYVSYSCTHGNNNTTPWFSSMTALYRNGTKIAYGDLRGSEVQGATIVATENSRTGGSVAFQFLDSPATTSAVTYQVYLMSDSPTYPATIGGSAVSSSADYISAPSTITVMEIAA